MNRWTRLALLVYPRRWRQLGDPEDLRALLVTDGTLPVLGVRPSAGRPFTEADDAPGSRGDHDNIQSHTNREAAHTPRAVR
jgi:hypothetical protein